MVDVKITGLAAAGAVTADDIFEISNDPLGSPVTQKATAAQIRTFVLAGASTLHDATIDPGLATDAAVHRYANFTALAASETFIPGKVFIIEMVHRPGTPVVETGDPTVAGPFVVRSAGSISGMPYLNGQKPVWDFDGHVINNSTASCGAHVIGIEIRNDGALIAAPFSGSATYEHCHIVGVDTGSSALTITAPAGVSLVAFDTAIDGSTFFGAMSVMLVDVILAFWSATTANWSGNVTWTGSYVCAAGTPGAVTLNGNSAKQYFIDVVRLNSFVQQTSGGALSFIVSTAGEARINMVGVPADTNITVTAAAGHVDISGDYATVICQGNTASGESIRRFDIASFGSKTVDLTGPCVAHVELVGGGAGAKLIVRGAHVQCDAHVSSSAVPVVELIGATDCYVAVALARQTGGAKPFAIDATSARSVLVLTGDIAAWTTPGTNLSATCAVIPNVGAVNLALIAVLGPGATIGALVKTAADTWALAGAGSALVVGRYEQDFGDGAATSFVITHNRGTRAVGVIVYRATTPFDEVDCEVLHTSTNTVTLDNFADVPTLNEYHVVVIG